MPLYSTSRVWDTMCTLLSLSFLELYLVSLWCLSYFTAGQSVPKMGQELFFSDVCTFGRGANVCIYFGSGRHLLLGGNSVEHSGEWDGQW